MGGRVAPGGGSSPGGRGRARRDCDRHTGCLTGVEGEWEGA